MFLRLVILFTIVPLVELALLIEVSKQITLMNTIAIVVLTGIVGAAMAKSQGFQVINRIQSELNSGRIPSDSFMDGALILAGALLLLTPGLLTDTFGFLALIPVTRNLLKSFLKKYFADKINSGEIKTSYQIDDVE